jgi:hypothetical protein
MSKKRNRIALLTTAGCCSVLGLSIAAGTWLFAQDFQAPAIGPTDAFAKPKAERPPAAAPRSLMDTRTLSEALKGYQNEPVIQTPRQQSLPQQEARIGLLKEAWREYLRVLEMVKAGNTPGETILWLADDAVPVGGDRFERHQRAYLAAMRQLKADLLPQLALPLDYDGLATEVGQIGWSTAKADAVAVEESITIVRFLLPNTAPIVKANFPESTSMTIRGGDLSVMMVKINNRWYWQPFGW